MVAAVSSLKYKNARVIADDEETAVNISVLYLIILSEFAVFITSILFLVGDELINLLNIQVILDYKYFLPIGVICLGLYGILVQWSFWKKIPNPSRKQNICSLLQLY